MLASVVARSVHADLGETREQVIAHYGKPVWQDSQHLWFAKEGVPGVVVLSADGKSIQEVYGWDKDVGQQQVMDVLLHNSQKQAWHATKLDYPTEEMVWRYTQPETKVKASYERHNTDDLSRVSYVLTIGL